MGIYAIFGHNLDKYEYFLNETNTIWFVPLNFMFSAICMSDVSICQKQLWESSSGKAKTEEYCSRLYRWQKCLPRNQIEIQLWKVPAVSMQEKWSRVVYMLPQTFHCRDDGDRWERFPQPCGSGEVSKTAEYSFLLYSVTALVIINIQFEKHCCKLFFLISFYLIVFFT